MIGVRNHVIIPVSSYTPKVSNHDFFFYSLPRICPVYDVTISSSSIDIYRLFRTQNHPFNMDYEKVNVTDKLCVLVV